MTNEEAIKVLRTESIELGGNAVSVARFLTALDVVVKALADVLDTDVGKNEPLTLDELRKMDNQPVWIEDVGEYKWHGSGWAIVDREYCLVRKASNGNPAFFERYGKEWIAYRQQPAENFGQKCCPDQDERKENENV